MINNKNLKNYFAHNGSSAVDLVFYRGKNITVESEDGIWFSTASPIRKHIPIKTIINNSIPNQKLEKTKNTNKTKISRRIDTTIIEQNREEVDRVLQLLAKGQTNEALETTNNLLRTASIPPKTRWGQRWFNKQCYDSRKEALQALWKSKNSGKEENLKAYGGKRKLYKQTIKKTKAEYMEATAKNKAEAAKSDPFIALRIKSKVQAHGIPIQKWEEHFREILNAGKKDQAFPSVATDVTSRNSIKITPEEIRDTIWKTKKTKAPGLDNVCNEHLKDTADTLIPFWTELFSKCIQTGEIPNEWRTAKMKVLYKGKGDPENPNSYRGIALENSAFKIFMKILTSRLEEPTENQIPECQFGFRRNKVTLQAVKFVVDEIEEALRGITGKPKYLAVFIDYKKAFDLLDRKKVMNKVKRFIGDTHPLSSILNNIMAYNFIEIDDGVTTTPKIRQTNGVLQGDPISPLLFNIATADITDILKNTNHTKLIMYADDMMLGGTNKVELQETLQKLEKWTQENGLHINTEKTVQMTFRNGGRPAKEDALHLNNEPLEIVNKFKYLGITLQTKATSFRHHVQERTTAAIRAIYNIDDLHLLSLDTAMTLFNCAISPIVTYGIELIWEKLSYSDLKKIEQVKARFLKRALRVGLTAPSRLVYELAKETFYIEDLRLTLPYTRAFDKCRAERTKKQREIDREFYATDAMIYRNWTRENQEQRHIITRTAIHGFHHKICIIERFHEPGEACVCKLCNQTCDRYHIVKCNKKKKSISDYTKD